MCLRIPDITLASGGEPTFLLAMAYTSQSRFLDYATARKIADEFGSPAYVYDMATLKANAADVRAFPNAV